jgi:hypothetical protein
VKTITLPLKQFYPAGIHRIDPSSYAHIVEEKSSVAFPENSISGAKIPKNCIS